MDESKNVVNLKTVVKRIVENKKLFFKTLPIAFVLSCAIILCIPRYYISEVKLVPEVESSLATSGAIGSLASSFGLDLGDMQSSDAISPLLYPDLMEDNSFVTSIFPVKVKSEDNEISTTYYEYLKKYQKQAWWNYVMGGIKKLFKSKSKTSQGNGKFNPYKLSEEDENIAQSLRGKVNLSIDKKTAVISIVVKDQDPLICKTIADSVKTKLQSYITNYRTSKARTDLAYYKKITAEAKQEYDRSRQLYASYSDANMDVVLESFRAKRDDLENEMQLKYNTYSMLNTQLQAAKAKVQERTPAFTLLKGASVPVKPDGPKRMMFVCLMLFLTFTFTFLYVIKDDVLVQLRA